MLLDWILSFNSAILNPGIDWVKLIDPDFLGWFSKPLLSNVFAIVVEWLTIADPRLPCWPISVLADMSRLVSLVSIIEVIVLVLTPL